MKNGRPQAKDMPDLDVLAAVRATQGRYGVARWSMLTDIEGEFAAWPPKLVLAKLRKLMTRGLVDGCDCGCRGDFVLTPAAIDLLPMNVRIGAVFPDSGGSDGGGDCVYREHHVDAAHAMREAADEERQVAAASAARADSTSG